jgi:HK97 family phage prohead protease
MNLKRLYVLTFVNDIRKEPGFNQTFMREFVFFRAVINFFLKYLKLLICLYVVIPIFKKYVKNQNCRFIIWLMNKEKKMRYNIDLQIDDSDKPKIIGYVIRYEIFYDRGSFKERIKAGAFDEAINDNIIFKKNRDSKLILGSTMNGTLRLKSNSIGLIFELDMPNTKIGRDILEEIRHGDIYRCGFDFIVAEDDWEYLNVDRLPERTIIKVNKLYEVYFNDLRAAVAKEI